MNINNLLSNDILSLSVQDSITTAAQRLLEHKVSILPVTDATGRYLGTFDMKHLLALLLPKAVLLEGGVSDLAFVSDPMETLCERMHEHGDQTVGEFIDKEARTVHPDSSLIEVVLLLYRGENDIPVVDKNSGKLLGMVSSAELLTRVCKGA